MTDINDDYDIEYTIEDCPESVFHERDTATKVPGVSKVLSITQSLSFTLKNLKLLRKNGLLSRWSYFRILFNKKEEESHLFIALSLLTVVSAVSGLVWISFNLIAEKSALLPFLFIIATVGSAIFNTIFLNTRSIKLFKNSLHGKFREKLSYISIPESNKELNHFVEKITEYDLNHSEKEALFNIAQKYPYDVNEQINKLMKLKEKIPVEAKESGNAFNIFDDTDKMLDELFVMRDSKENKKLLKDFESVLKEASHRKKFEELGISMEELADVAEFLEAAKKENNTDSTNISRTSGMSKIVENMNTAGGELIDEVNVGHSKSNTTAAF